MMPMTDITTNPDIFVFPPELLYALLRDNTLSSSKRQVNIFWATDNYAKLGAGYQYYDQISLEAITGINDNIIVPRAFKSKEEKRRRSREMAEVFTPAWICNEQNNLVDETWFGRKGVFNQELDLPGNQHSWEITPEPVTFPEGKTWLDYVRDNRLEITCGEAPYLTSRYDAVSGEAIPVERRIGLLDRKLRVVGENTSTPQEWIDGAKAAAMSTYGYEWQGDNIIIARKSLLLSIVEFYQTKFNDLPSCEQLLEFAKIIAWNIWQMDGLKAVIPNSCKKVAQKPKPIQRSLFDDDNDDKSSTPVMQECPGCKQKHIFSHTGEYCNIMDWEINTPIKFVSLINRQKYEDDRKKYGIY